MAAQLLTPAEVEALARHLDDETDWSTIDEFWAVWGPRTSSRLQRLIATARSGAIADVHVPCWTGQAETSVFTRIAGCACGWRCPPDAQNSDDAFVMHVAFARLGLTRDASPEASAISTNPDLEAAAQEHADRVWTADYEEDVRFTDLCKTFIAGARWHRDVGDSEANAAGKLLRETIHVLEKQHVAYAELAQTAIAWSKADRIADDRSADLACFQDGAASAPSALMHATLEKMRVAFHAADQHAVQCDDKFREAARKLAEVLDPQPPAEETP